MNGLTQADRVTLLLAQYEKLDRVMTGKPIRCILDKGNVSAPVAWSVVDKDEVFFNGARLPTLETLEGYVVMNGLNDHETGHHIYTPDMETVKRLSTDFVSRHGTGRGLSLYGVLVDSKYHMAFNILEDARLENAMVRRWPVMRHYFTAMFLLYCLGSIDDAYILGYGRRYLSTDIRRALRQAYKGTLQDRRLLRSIITPYLGLNLFNADDMQTSAELVVELQKFLEDKAPTLKHEACNVAAQKTKESSDPTNKQKQAQKVRRQEGDKAKLDAEFDDLSAQSMQQAAGEDAQDGADEQAGLNNASGADVAESLQKAVSEAFNDIKSDDDVKKTVNSQRDGVNGNSALIRSPRIKLRKQAVLPQSVLLAQRIKRSLAKVQDEVEAGWDYEREVGRVNMGRAMRRGNMGRGLRDEWNPGNQVDNSVEVVALFDASPSMEGSHSIPACVQASWVMKRAADDSNVRLTSLAYSDDSHVIYMPDDKAALDSAASFGVLGGSTIPYSGIRDAYFTLKRSKRPRKLFFIMTDGAWHTAADHRLWPDGPASAGAAISLMNREGIVTAIVLYQMSRYGSTHNCQLSLETDDLMDMPRFMEKIVAALMRVKVY